jgi:hypothetical protein
VHKLCWAWTATLSFLSACRRWKLQGCWTETDAQPPALVIRAVWSTWDLPVLFRKISAGLLRMDTSGEGA